MSKKNENVYEMYEAIIKSQAGILFIKGRPGEGKTAIAEYIANRNGWQFIDLRLAQLDSAEVIGIPVRDERNGHVVHTYALPEWAVMANEKPTLVFFDELNRAVLETRNAALQILNERKIGWNFKFNDKVFFMSAGNLGEEDGTEVEELDAALKNRLVTKRHNLTLDEWTRWAKSAEVNQYVVDFLNKNPEAIYDEDGAKNDEAFASYRSWTNLAAFIDSLGYTDPQDMLRAVKDSGTGASYVGKSIRKFVTYLENQQIINIQDVLNRWSSVKKHLSDKDQSIVYGLIADLETFELEELSDKQIKNVVEFLKIVHEDKLIAYLRGRIHHILQTKGDEIVSNGSKAPKLTGFPKFLSVLRSFKEYKNDIMEVLKNQRNEEAYGASESEESDD